MAARYRDNLARDGITVEIVYTDGSVDIAGLLTSAKVDVALLQGGIPMPNSQAEAIAGVFFETMLFILRKGQPIARNPALWTGLRINSGAVGSGTRAAFEDFQKAVGLTPSANSHSDLPYSDALAALSAGRIDMAVFVTTVDAPCLARAYTDTTLDFLPLSYVATISRRLEYATVATLPSGAVSLAPVVPPVPQKVLALDARRPCAPTCTRRWSTV